MKGSLYEERNRPNGKVPRLPESLERVERCEPYISALGNETLATNEYGLNLFRVWIPQEFQAEVLRISRRDNTQRGIAGKVENIGLVSQCNQKSNNSKLLLGERKKYRAVLDLIT